jgi:hypothetical protein
VGEGWRVGGGGAVLFGWPATWAAKERGAAGAVWTVGGWRR